MISSSAQEPPRRLSGPHPIIRTLDTNNDGSLSSEELREASKSLLKLDRNNDGNSLRGTKASVSVSRPPERTSPIARENGSRFSSERDRRRSGGPRPTDLGESDLEIGQAGIAWYPKLEDGLAELSDKISPLCLWLLHLSAVVFLSRPGYTSTKNSLFSDPEVIKSSRKFICVRIESYESEANQKIVRSHLGADLKTLLFVFFHQMGKKTYP